MTEKVRKVLRTSEEESANPEWVVIGQRLVVARDRLAQPAMAEKLGVHKNTYARWERGEREIGADGLQRLADMGWSPTWVVTGAGPERLGGAEGPTGEGSQSVTRDDLSIALQLVSEVVDGHKLPMSPEKRAELTLSVAELHAEGVPEAKLLRFVSAAVQ